MRRLPTLVVGILVLAGGTALAQDNGDVSAGYRFMRGSDVSVGKGWYVDVTGHLTDVVSLVGDVGGSYKSDSAAAFGVTAEADLKIHTFMGGAKFRASMVNPHVVPFGQVLFGAGHLEAKAIVSGVTVLDESTTEPVMIVSGGVEARPGGPVGVRAAIGWTRVLEDDATNFFQVSVGAVFGF